uniref:GNAT family N-acetyltransferase n=1 Tax=Nocardia abscessus TaxID=120957 RepID=UPI002453D529
PRGAGRAGGGPSVPCASAYGGRGVAFANAICLLLAAPPDLGGPRIGKRLIDRAARWAVTAGLPAMTLTTFTDVAWNGPYYQRLGFRYLSAEEETQGLVELRAAERAHGLDRWPRACMRAELTAWSME